MANPKNILVTGANGQLGNECRALAEKFPSYHFTFLTRQELSIGDLVALDQLFSDKKIDYCINCAAYTAVDKAETEKEEAFAVNAVAAGDLAGICKRHSARLIHISTDYVFDGRKNGYTEEDPTAPLNVYGASKLEGERLAVINDPSVIIVRTSWVYSSFGNNFVKTMMRLMSEKDSISVVNDQFGSPTYARDLAAAIFKIIETHNPVPGIYNYCNEGVITWFEFANAIKEMGGFKCEVKPISSADYPVAARRPQYSILLTDKIRQTFHVETPYWKTSLQNCIGLLK